MKIQLDKKKIDDFRDEINDDVDLILGNEKIGIKWNNICACMDRISSTVLYLNRKELHASREYDGCAFDFIEFIFHSSVMLDCVKELAQLFTIDDIGPECIFFQHKEKFSGKTNDKNEDDIYFEYIRSISSVHPYKTDRKQHALFRKYDGEVSPFVLWNDWIGLNSGGDISLYVYCDSGKGEHRNIGLYIEELFAYVENRYNRIDLLTQSLRRTKDDIITNYKNTPIKTPRDCIDYKEYLTNLLIEADRRCSFLSGYIECAGLMLDLENIPTVMMKKYEKHCNALRLAISDVHKKLQDMDYKCLNSDRTLIQELYLPRILKKDEWQMSDYCYEKTGYLYHPCHNVEEMFYRMQAKELYDHALTKYATITEDDFDNLGRLQLLALINTGLYFYSLDNDTVLNKLIPDSKEYR